MVEKCCLDWMKVGYIGKRKNEVYICPSCGKIFLSPSIGKFKAWWFKHFVHQVRLYDDKQVRLYWRNGMATVIADSSGKEIEKIEQAEWEKVKKENGLK